MATNKDLWMLPSKRRVIRRTVAGGFNEDRDGDGTLGSGPPEPEGLRLDSLMVTGTGLFTAGADDPAAFTVGATYGLVDAEGGDPVARDTMIGEVFECVMTAGPATVGFQGVDLTGMDLTGIEIWMTPV